MRGFFLSQVNTLFFQVILLGRRIFPNIERIILIKLNLPFSWWETEGVEH